jgi:FKBP-type peptidyl-prolyl cis-trans isomerase 2
MPAAKTGDTVRVHYRGSLADGSVFDSSEGGEPLEFTLGRGQVIKGFDKAVLGMKDGDIRSVNIPPNEAYGPHHTDLMVTVPRAELPAGIDPEVGQQFEVQQDDGEPLVVRVAAMTDTTLTLDGNHPLAGETLTFRIEFVKVV